MQRKLSFIRVSSLFIILGLMFFPLFGCGQDDTQQDDTQDNNSEEEIEENDEINEEEEMEEDEATESTENVIGTDIPLPPGAQLVYNDDEFIVYATDASLEDMYDYYRDMQEFSSSFGSRAEEYGFALETELAKMVRGVGQTTGDPEAFEELEREIDTEIRESASGRIFYVVGLEAGSEEIEHAFVLREDIWETVPEGKNVIYFFLWDND